MTENKNIEVGGRLHSIATGNVLVGANEILDDDKNKKQSEINTETYSLVNDVNERLNGLSPDQQSALSVAAKATNNEIKLGYYVCGTEGNVAAKVISDATGYVLSLGGSIKVKMTNANTANNATLNINSTGAKPLYYDGERASANNTWEAGETVEVYYDGTNFYANNVAGSGGDGVFDVSEKYPTSGVEGGNTYTLDGALAVLNANLPASKKKGGMSIKFVQSSDNKYVQYLYNCTSTAIANFTNIDNWEKVNLEEEFEALTHKDILLVQGVNYPNSSGHGSSSEFCRSEYFAVKKGDYIRTIDTSLQLFIQYSEDATAPSYVENKVFFYNVKDNGYIRISIGKVAGGNLTPSECNGKAQFLPNETSLEDFRRNQEILNEVNENELNIPISNFFQGSINGSGGEVPNGFACRSGFLYLKAGSTINYDSAKYNIGLHKYSQPDNSSWVSYTYTPTTNEDAYYRVVLTEKNSVATTPLDLLGKVSYREPESLRTFIEKEITTRQSADVKFEKTIATNKLVSPIMDFVQGGIYNGNEVANSTRVRSGYYQFKIGTTIRNTGNFKTMVFRYSSQSPSGYIDYVDYGNNICVISEDNYYYRIVLYKQNQADNITPSEVENKAYYDDAKNYNFPINDNVDSLLDIVQGTEYNMQWEQGYISGSAYFNSDYRIRTSEFYPCAGLFALQLHINVGYTAYITLFTKDNVFVKQLTTNNKEEQIFKLQEYPTAAKFKVSATNARIDKVEVVPAEGTNIKVYAIDSFVASNLVERVDSMESGDVPAYWEDELQDSITKIDNINLSVGNTGDSFVFVTDTHTQYNQGHTANLVKRIIDSTSVRKVLHGGDVITGYADKSTAISEIRKHVNSFFFTPLYIARGNHDDNQAHGSATPANKISESEFYELALRQIEDKVIGNGLPYYYFDVKPLKIRYIVLDIGTVASSDVDYYDTMFAWFDNVVSELNNQWGVIVMQHIGYALQTDDNGKKYEAVTYPIPVRLMTDLNSIHNDPTKPNVLANVFGHTHLDWADLSESGYPMICTTCDGGGLVSEPYDYEFPGRQAGHNTEHAFDLYSITPSYLRTVRVGEGVDRIVHSGWIEINIGETHNLSTVYTASSWQSYNKDGGLKYVNTGEIYSTQPIYEPELTSTIISVDNGIVTALTTGYAYAVLIDSYGNKEYFGIHVVA